MPGDREGDDADLGLAACVGASLAGLLASTAWVLVAPGSVSPLGLLFIFGGVGVCYLGIQLREGPDDLLFDDPP